jgi:hypothetical protein
MDTEKKVSGILVLFFILSLNINAQPVPAGDENIPYLMTFGPKAETSWGDDDFSQTFFFMVPENYKGVVYIRVYDPEVGGEVDELDGVWDTQMTYSVYGGKGAYTDPAARETDPKGNYKSGNLLATKTFGTNAKYEKNWYTFGPFNPTDGEYDKQYTSYIFKVICDGISGDDGNMYRYYLSTSANENKLIEGANAFAFEYSFRMHDNPKEVSHIYPFVDDKTITVKVSNFDWDNDGFIRVVSVAKNGLLIKASAENNWVEDNFKIVAEEKNTSLDFQFIKKSSPPVKNNNVVVNVRNQYNELLKFYTIPIGGVPKFKHTIVREKLPSN